MIRTLPLALLLLVGCAAEAQRPAQTAEATPRALQGRAIGEPVSCLPLRQVRDTDAVTDSVILFHVGNRTYRNDLPQSCPRLSRETTAFASRTSSTQLCRGEIIRVFDPGTGFEFGACTLGAFTPYELPADVPR